MTVRLPLPQLDELDRRIIVALQTDGRASWTAVAELCGTSVPTVARRASRLFTEGIVRVGVAPDINHAGPADLFFIRIQCVPSRQAAVAEELAQRGDIRFLALMTGSVNIVGELNVRTDDLPQVGLIDEIQGIDGVLRCEADLLLHTYKATHDWSRQLLTGEEHVYTPSEPHECDPGHFDDIDRAVLAVLREDGRAGFQAVADVIGVNESTVRRRFDTLRANGCVSVVTVVPAPALGFESEIIFMIRVLPANLDSTARKLATYRGVRYVAATLNESSIECEVILPTTRDVFEFVTRTLGGLPGVQGWTANMETLTLKRGFIQTPWWRAGTDMPNPARRRAGGADDGVRGSGG